MIDVLFIHSAGAQGQGEGSTALVTALGALLPDGYRLRAPIMPRPDQPEAYAWIEAVRTEMHAGESPLILIGHSLGGSVLLQALERFGIPRKVAGIVVLAAPFWGAPDWEFDDFALTASAKQSLSTLHKVIVMRGDRDEVVAEDHPERYRQIMPQAEIRILANVDHEAADAAPAVVQAIADITEPGGV